MPAENEIRNIKLFEEELRNIKQMAFDAAHPVNETYTQYPQQYDPMTLYNKDGVTSVWEIQSQYSGAFFRSSNAPNSVYKADDENQYYIQNPSTLALIPINASTDGGPTISPTPTPGQVIIIEGKTYKGYAVTATSRNAADYIDKTNSLSLQDNQNQYHSHTINHNHTIYSQTASALCGGGSTSTPTSVCFDVDSHSHTYWNSGIVSISVVLNPHNGNSGTNGSSTDTEARPDNFTQIIWKRIS